MSGRTTKLVQQMTSEWQQSIHMNTSENMHVPVHGSLKKINNGSWNVRFKKMLCKLAISNI